MSIDLPSRTKLRAAPTPYWRMAAKGKLGEIWLYDYIGDPWAGTMSNDFRKELKALGEIDRLNLYVNSPGGSVFEGIAIHNILKRHPAEVVASIDGMAASIASVVVMAADTIIIASNAMMMIHDPMGCACGSAADMRKMGEALDKVREQILVSYVERTSGDEQALSDMLTAETWFTAEEAVAAGLADEIAQPVAMAAVARHDLSEFKHPPVLALARPKASAPNRAALTRIQVVQSRLAQRGINRR